MKNNRRRQRVKVRRKRSGNIRRKSFKKASHDLVVSVLNLNLHREWFAAAVAGESYPSDPSATDTRYYERNKSSSKRNGLVA